MGDLYSSTELVEAVKSLAPSNVKGHGGKPQLTCMAHVYTNV